MIPVLMRAERRWLVWRYSSEGKKLPHDPKDPKGRAIDSTDEKFWVSYEEAQTVVDAGGVDGLGFALGDGWTGVDLDDVRDPATGALTPAAKAIVDQIDTYTEVSPSGTGVKAFLKAWLGKNRNRPGLEIYGYARYFCVTGLHLPGTPPDVQSRSDELNALLQKEFGAAIADDGPQDDDAVDDETVEDLTVDDTNLIDGGRNNALARFGGSLRRIGLNDDEIKASLRAVNVARCKPPLEPHEVDTIARSIAKYPPTKAERAIDWMNEQHALVFEAGKTVIFTERKDDLLDRIVYDRSSAEDIRLLYRNSKVHLKVGGKPVVKTLGDYWLDHAGRRQYRGVIFDPENRKPDSSKLNLWRGFTVSPKPGDWSLFDQHLRHVICRDEEHVYHFVIRWLARLFQKPGRPAETGIALRGKQGTGKGIVGRVVGSIFGQHYLHVTHAHHLVGHFNAHLQDSVFVFADEAVAPQDKAAVSALKTLVSEPNVTIERKGKDAFTVKNVIHLFMASNHDWVLPAELDERRWTMLDVAPDFANNHAYFNALLAQMKNGGREAFLHDMLALDLTGWNHRTIPHTAALLEQKQATMSPLLKWWFTRLEDGALNNGNWPGELPKDTIYLDYIDSQERMGVSRRCSESEFWQALKKVTPAWTRMRKRVANKPTWFTAVPPLGECRAMWDVMTKTPHRWETAGIDPPPALSDPDEPPHPAEQPPMF